MTPEIAAALADVNVCLPGVIVSYDGKTATVRPTMPKQLANGDTLAPPQIVRVPVCWPIADGGRAMVTVPLKPGDAVLLHFSQRSIENWLSGSDQAPDDPRQFDLSDCIATPVMRPGPTADTTNVCIQYGAGTLKIAPNGSVTISTPKLTVNAPISEFNGDVTVSGNTSVGGNHTIAGEMTAGGIPYSTHRHTNVETGPGTSGGPV